MDKHFSEGCVLVVGGSGGVGSACVKRFAADGATVVFTYHSNLQAAEALQAELGERVSFVKLANQDAAAVTSLMDELSAKHGGINTLVNAAGFNIPQKFIADITPELWRKVMDEDVNGFFNLVSASLPYLRQSQGSYVFISSAGLFKYPPGDVLSVAPKATIEHTIKGIAKEEGVHGVRANSIALGVIDAGIFHRLLNEENSFFDDYRPLPASGRWLPLVIRQNNRCFPSPIAWPHSCVQNLPDYWQHGLEQYAHLRKDLEFCSL